LPQALQHFERAHPLVEIRIVLSATRCAVRALLDGDLDVAISDATRTDARLVSYPLFASDLVAVVAPSHAWARRPFVRAADFAGEHLLRYATARHESTLVTEILDPAGVQPRREETVELTEALIELVRAGRGVTVLASWIVSPNVARGEVVAVPIRERAVRRRWCAITRRQRRPDPHVVALVEALRSMDLPGLARRRRAVRTPSCRAPS